MSELGAESGRPVAKTAGAGADKNLVSALLCFKIKSNLAIEVNMIGVSVFGSILNPDNHHVGVVLLGKADEIAAPVVVVRQKVNMIVAVPTQLPTLWSIEAHFRAFVFTVRVSLQAQSHRSFWCAHDLQRRHAEDRDLNHISMEERDGKR